MGDCSALPDFPVVSLSCALKVILVIKFSKLCFEIRRGSYGDRRMLQ